MNELSTTIEPVPSGASLMLNAQSLGQLVAFADLMAKSAISVPDHLRGKPSDCLAIAMQAAQWGMNPFAVAQKTHVVSGRLGYEAQLVNAVIESSGAIDDHFHYEYRGTGNTLECRVGATLRGDANITWGEWYGSAEVQVKNSPLWKTNPKQQLGYLQVKNWARQYAPGAILGVYTADELEGIAPEKRTGPQRKSAAAAVSAPATPMVDEVPAAEQQRGAPAAEPVVAAPASAAKPSAPAPVGAAGAISVGQVNYLRGKLKSAGVAEASICDRFQVTGVELLSAEQFDELKSELLANA